MDATVLVSKESSTTGKNKLDSLKAYLNNLIDPTRNFDGVNIKLLLKYYIESNLYIKKTIFRLNRKFFKKYYIGSH